MSHFHISVALASIVLLAACDSGTEGETPTPSALTREAVGHYCGMIVVDHAGPKAQIHLRSGKQIVWFTSVRDAIVFTRLPEEPSDIAAFYVNDMGRAETWDRPGEDTWIDANTAIYVIGSRRRGGMGALEAVPFSEQAAAEAFVSRYGGDIAALSDIPDDYVLGDDGDASGAPLESHDGSAMPHPPQPAHEDDGSRN